MEFIELLFTNTKRVFSLIIGFMSFAIGTVADEGADIVIRALPLATPMPNAISVFWVSQTTLHFSWWQALAFAVTIEFSLFGVFEVALTMFDGYQDDPQWYRVPLIAACIISGVVMFLIVGFVYYIEQANPIMAMLPFLSAGGAGALAFKRAHARRQAFKIAAKLPRTARIMPSVIAKDDTGALHVGSVTPSNPTGFNSVRQAQQEEKRQNRHTALLSALSIVDAPEAINKSKLAEQLNVSRQTIIKDIDTLIADGRLRLNGKVHVTDET